MKTLKRVGAVVGSAVVAGVGTANTDVTTAFTGIASDNQATIVSVAGVAIGVLGVILAFKYGKKIFNKIAN